MIRNEVTNLINKLTEEPNTESNTYNKNAYH